jgi:hypothetical protein
MGLMLGVKYLVALDGVCTPVVLGDAGSRKVYQKYLAIIPGGPGVSATIGSEQAMRTGL